MNERMTRDFSDRETSNRQGSPARSVHSSPELRSGSPDSGLAGLHRLIGNQAVRRLAETVQRRDEDGRIEPAVERGITQSRGGGRPLDKAVQGSMEQAFGTDFSQVRIHTGAQADSLNRSLSARAFTTGQDIFFKEGNYNPGSSAGRELLAHELTHVVQQGEDIRASLTLGQPGDAYESEADDVARHVMRLENGGGSDQVHRQPEEEEETIQAWKDRP